MNDSKIKEKRVANSLIRFTATYLGNFILVVALLICCNNVLAAEKGWILIPGISHHVNTTTKHNERNWGIGYEWQTSSGRNWDVMIYDNSYWKPSLVVMSELTSYQFSDRLRFRLMGGGVTGYRYLITPGVVPVWTYETKNYGFDALTIPSIGGRMGIFAIQFKVKF